MAKIYKMSSIFHSNKKYIYSFFCFLFIWIILFEFILSPNNILPKPSIFISSVISLLRDYQFQVNLLSSFSAIYLSSFVAGLFIWILRIQIINENKLFRYISFPLERISGIVPGILMGLLLILWVPDSELCKYIFMFFLCFTYLVNKLENELKKVNSEFVDAAVSLGVGKNFIYDKVFWKVIEPALTESLTELHYYLWSMLIAFEVIKGGIGLGTILKMAILYNDLAGYFASIFIICVIIFIGTSLIKYFRNKIIFWSIN